MKVTKRDVGLLIMLVGILAAILSYNFLYQKNIEKAEAETAKLKELQDTQAGLKELEDNLPFYKSEIERMDEENAEIVAHYPADVLPENEIMYAVELQENTDVYYSALSYGSPVELSTGLEEQTGVHAYDTTMSMTYQCSYEGLKEVIRHNLAQNDRRVINSVTASYDRTTGKLTGSMTLDQYTMSGTDKFYVEPYVPSMNMGTDNIFGTIELPEEVEEEAAPADETPVDETTEG